MRSRRFMKVPSLPCDSYPGEEAGVVSGPNLGSFRAELSREKPLGWSRRWRRLSVDGAEVGTTPDSSVEAIRTARETPRAGGNVEKWLVEVETIMKKSLALSIDLACDEFFKIERRQWLRNWPGQTILTVNQITWVMAMEEAIENGAALRLPQYCHREWRSSWMS